MAQGKYSDGRTIDVVAPTGGVTAGNFYRVSGWNGIAELTVAAGETFPLNIDPTYVFYTPMTTADAAAVGALLYVAPGGGLLTATATGNVAAAKVHQAKDANNIVGVRLLNIS